MSKFQNKQTPIEMIDAQIDWTDLKEGINYDIISDADDKYRLRTRDLSKTGLLTDYTIVPDPSTQVVTTYDKLTDIQHMISLICQPDVNGEILTKLSKNGMYFPNDDNPTLIPISMEYVGPDSDFNFNISKVDSWLSVDSPNLATYKINTPNALKYPARAMIKQGKLPEYSAFNPRVNYSYIEETETKNSFINHYNTKGGYISGFLLNNQYYLIFSLTPVYIISDSESNMSFNLPSSWYKAKFKVDDLLKLDFRNLRGAIANGEVSNLGLKDTYHDFPIYMIPTGPYYIMPYLDYVGSYDQTKNNHSDDLIKIPTGTKIGDIEYLLRTNQHPLQTDARYYNHGEEYYPSSFDVGQHYSYYEDNTTGRVRHRDFKMYLSDGYEIINNIIVPTNFNQGINNVNARFDYHEGNIWKISTSYDYFSTNFMRSIIRNGFAFRNHGMSNVDPIDITPYLPINANSSYFSYRTEDIDMGGGLTWRFVHLIFDSDTYINDLVIYGYTQQMPSGNWGTNAKFGSYYWVPERDLHLKRNYSVSYAYQLWDPIDVQDYYSIDSYIYATTPIDLDGKRPNNGQGDWIYTFVNVINNNKTTTTANFKPIGWDNFKFGFQGSFPTNSLFLNLSSFRVEGDENTMHYNLVNGNLSKVTNQLISPISFFGNNAMNIIDQTKVVIGVDVTTQVIDKDRITVSPSRKYHPGKVLAMQNISMLKDHYSNINKDNDPVLVTSDVIEAMIEGKNRRSYTNDYLMSLFLTNDSQLLQPLISEVENFDPIKYQEQLSNKIDEQITKDGLLPEEVAGTKAALLRDIDANNPNLGTMFAYMYDKYGSKIKVDLDEFHTYRTIVAANAFTEGLLGLAGHLRILNTNSSETPIYYELVDAGFSDSAIKLYSRLSLSIVSSIYGADIPNLLDSSDISNEMTLIYNLVSNQLSNTTDLMNRILNIFSSGGFDVNDSEQQQLISNFSNITNQVANDLLTTVGEFDKLNINDNIPRGTYNAILLERNISHATSYAKSLADALRSDPYLALRQHSDYIRKRTDKATIKLNMIEMILDSMDFVTKIPEYLLNGISSVANITKTIASIGLNAVTSTLKIVDNVDKLIFIGETYLSKGILEYSTIPTLFDDIFSLPAYHGSERDYGFINKQAMVDTKAQLNVGDFITNQLIVTKDKPVIVGGVEFRYNDYNIMNLFTRLNGYYIPNSGHSGLPLIISGVDGSAQLYPNLIEFKPKYPDKGNLLKLFLQQLSLNDVDYQIVSNLTPFIPTSPAVKGIQSGVVVAIALAAAAAAFVGAGGILDPFSSIPASVAAGSAATLVNGIALAEISNRRTDISEDKSVYTYFTRHYSKITDDWSMYLNDINNISSKYTFVVTNEFLPLFSEASEFKKAILLFKESIALIFNTIAMVSVSYMVGKVTRMLVDSGRKLRDRFNEDKARRFENKKTKEEADNMVNAIDDDIKANEQAYNDGIKRIDNDANLTDIEKAEKKALLTQIHNNTQDDLIKDKNTILEGAKSKINLNSTQSWRLSQALATRYDVPRIATGRTGPKLLSLAGIGSLTAGAISSMVDGFKKFTSKLTDDDKQDLEESSSNNSELISSIVNITSQMAEKILAMSDDITIIKKYI